MTSAPLAVLGGYGAVGSTAVRRLVESGTGPVRVGGRDARAAEALCADLPADAAVPHAVDLDDDASLAGFCAGAAVVVNCAGPSYRVLDRVARAAWAAGAHYVDVAGDAPARSALTAGDHPPADAVAVLSAGVMPGLSGLLPRVLLADGDAARIDVHVGGAARMTPVSAADVLLATGPEHGTSLAVWRHGAVVERTLHPRWNTELRGFRGRVHAVPFLTTEAADLGRRHAIAELRHYSVYVSERIPTVLATAWAHAPADPLEWSADLISAAEADVRDHGRYYVIMAERYSDPETPGPVRWIALRTLDTYQLSGVVTALAATAVLAGTVRPGIHTAAEALDPVDVLRTLDADPLVRIEHGHA